MNGIIESIRSHLVGRRVEQLKSQAVEYRDLVRRVADGETPDVKTIERILSPHHPDVGAKCPTNPKHRSIKQYQKIVPSENDHNTICNECGATWRHDGPLETPPSPDGRKTLADLERDVQTLLERRQWRQELDRLPAARKELAEGKRQLQAATERIDAAVRERDELMRRLRLEVVEAVISRAESFELQLLKTCQDPELVEQVRLLTIEHSTAVERLRSLRKDLWGDGQPGTFDHAHRDTTGSRQLSYQRQIEGHVRQRDVAKHRKLQEEAEAHFKREVEPRLTEISRLEKLIPKLGAQLAELEAQKLTP